MKKLTGDMITAIVIISAIILGAMFISAFYNYTEMRRSVTCTEAGGQYTHGGCKGL